jgi:transcriptional regulator with XRE-family HTH domain
MGQSPRPRPKHLATKLRQLRGLLHLTQEQMAEAVRHIDSPPQPGHISEFELGKREPSLLFLLAVARLAGIPLEFLVDDALNLPGQIPIGRKIVKPKATAKTTKGKKRGKVTNT